MKYNHKGMYYRLRKLGIVFLVLISIGTIVAVPTYITFREMNNQAQHAEEEQPDLLQEEDIDSSSY